jgi:hypothetical protein
VLGLGTLAVRKRTELLWQAAGAIAALTLVATLL